MTRHAGREYGVVVSGILTVTVNFDDHLLWPGDSIAFPSTSPHRLWNAGGEPVRPIWVPPPGCGIRSPHLTPTPLRLRARPTPVPAATNRTSSAHRNSLPGPRELPSRRLETVDHVVDRRGLLRSARDPSNGRVGARGTDSRLRVLPHRGARGSCHAALRGCRRGGLRRRARRDATPRARRATSPHPRSRSSMIRSSRVDSCLRQRVSRRRLVSRASASRRTRARRFRTSSTSTGT